MRPPRGRRTGPHLVTLSSDVGAAYAAQMKAVLAHVVPPGFVVDLAHDLRPHDVAEAAFVVRAMAARFPSGTVHVVVIDPGVGGRRAAVVVACRDGSAAIGPDNGVLAPLVDALGGGRAYRIDPNRLRAPPRVGTTFDGRDLFAPAAALVASGTPPSALGRPAFLARLPGPSARRTPVGAEGKVAHVDRFGNVITTVPANWVPRGAAGLELGFGGRRRTLAFVRSYEGARRGRLVVLGSSFGTLEVAIAEGSAAARLGARVGDRIRFGWPVRSGRVARRNRK